MRILLTGAAGLIGGDVAARLVAAGHRVTGFVHKSRDIRANDGRKVALSSVVAGDISLPRFGLSEKEWRALAQGHDMLIHCAATVRFDLDDETYQRVNVGGALNAVALARLGTMPLLYVSTAYVCGTRNGLILESDPLPNAARPQSSFANGYEASKAAAERIIRDSGLEWVIARPSIVVGEMDSGAIRQFGTIYAAFKLFAQGKVQHMPADPDATFDLVPIDYVTRALVLLTQQLAQHTDKAAGGTYHLVSGQPVRVRDFIACIAAYPQFSPPCLIAPQDFDLERLSALERRLYRRVAGQYASYFQRNPTFDDRAFRALNGDCEDGCPPTGKPFIHRLIAYCIAAGFLPDKG